MGASPTQPCLNELITCLLARQPCDEGQLHAQGSRYAGRVLSGLAPDLPEDQRQDVIHQGFENLLRADLAQLDASGLEPTAFFRVRIVSALRQVRASFARPGAPTRRRRAAAEFGGDGPGRSRPPGPARDLAAEQAYLASERRRDAEQILAVAPPVVASALRQMCYGDQELGVVAKGLGLSRFALKRRIDSFAAVYRRAG